MALHTAARGTLRAGVRARRPLLRAMAADEASASSGGKAAAAAISGEDRAARSDDDLSCIVCLHMPYFHNRALLDTLTTTQVRCSDGKERALRDVWLGYMHMTCLLYTSDAAVE